MTIKKGYADTSDGQVHYRIQEDGSGPPLLLFHMTASSSASYESLMEELAGKVPTIAFDTPGYGASFKPSCDGDIVYVGKIILEALDAMGVDKFHAFGHHTGSSIALELACVAPERAISATLNGLSYQSPEESEQMVSMFAYPNPIEPVSNHMLTAWARVAKGLETAPHIQLPDDVVQRELLAALQAGEDWLWAYRGVFRYNVMEKMEQVTRPIFFVIAKHDGIMPWHQRAVEAYPQYPSYVVDSDDYGVFYSELAPHDLAPRILEFMKNAEQSD